MRPNNQVKGDLSALLVFVVGTKPHESPAMLEHAIYGALRKPLFQGDALKSEVLTPGENYGTGELVSGTVLSCDVVGVVTGSSEVGVAEPAQEVAMRHFPPPQKS